jgi:putative lipoprotein
MIARALLPLLFAVFFVACASHEIPPELQDPARVEGTLTYRERVTLPGDAIVRLSLFALPRPGAPATLVNEDTMNDPGQIPIEYWMFYRRDTIEQHLIYAIQARIEVAGKTWFENRELVPVITNHALRNVEIVLDQVAH